MRGLAILPVLICGTAFAQNWALLNPAYKYNYSNDGSYTISNQIFVTHIDTLGVDSFRYELNRIGVVCDTCVFTSSTCWGEDQTVVRFHRPQFLGGEAVEKEGIWWFTTTDTLRIEPAAHLGATWTSPDGIIALVISEETEQVFGEEDSTKRITFTSGETLTISKDHGVLGLGTGQIEYGLIGIEGLEVGAQFPTITDFFDYSPGDILQYVKEGSNVAGNELHYTTALTKYRILDREDTIGRTDYDIRYVYHSEMTAYDVLDGFAFIGSYPSTAVDTFVLSIEHDRWTPSNYFGCSWFNSLWPSAVCRLENGAWGDPLTWMHVTIEPSGGYVVKAEASAQGVDQTVLCVDDTDSTRSVFSGSPEFQLEYHEGIGRVYEHYFFFEAGYTEYLVGYMLDGVQTGTIYSDGSMVGTEELLIRPSLRIFPVPASDELHLAADQVIRNWTITDQYGREVDQGWINAAVGSINTSELPAGIYILRVGNGGRFEATRFVIAR